MSTLESLVPPLELCKQISEGCFEDSVFVWWTDCYGTIVIKRIDTPYEYGIVAPAPTLAEILAEIHCGGVRKAGPAWEAYQMTQIYQKEPCKYDKNPATAALKLWLEFNKKEKGK